MAGPVSSPLLTHALAAAQTLDLAPKWKHNWVPVNAEAMAIAARGGPHGQGKGKSRVDRASGKAVNGTRTKSAVRRAPEGPKAPEGYSVGTARDTVFGKQTTVSHNGAQVGMVYRSTKGYSAVHQTILAPHKNGTDRRFGTRLFPKGTNHPTEQEAVNAIATEHAAHTGQPIAKGDWVRDKRSDRIGRVESSDAAGHVVRYQRPSGTMQKTTHSVPADHLIPAPEGAVEVDSFNSDPSTGKYEARVDGHVVSGPHTSIRAARAAGDAARAKRAAAKTGDARNVGDSVHVGTDLRYHGKGTVESVHPDGTAVIRMANGKRGKVALDQLHDTKAEAVAQQKPRDAGGLAAFGHTPAPAKPDFGNPNKGPNEITPEQRAARAQALGRPAVLMNRGTPVNPPTVPRNADGTQAAHQLPARKTPKPISTSVASNQVRVGTGLGAHKPPRAQYTHNGQLVQSSSNGKLGTKVQSYGAGAVEVMTRGGNSQQEHDRAHGQIKAHFEKLGYDVERAGPTRSIVRNKSASAPKAVPSDLSEQAQRNLDAIDRQFALQSTGSLQRIADGEGDYGVEQRASARRILRKRNKNTDLSERVFKAATRAKDAKTGVAMDDGSFPIPDTDALRRAIASIGRANPDKRAAVKAHIKARARALGATEMLPAGW